MATIEDERVAYHALLEGLRVIPVDEEKDEAIRDAIKEAEKKSPSFADLKRRLAPGQLSKLVHSLCDWRVFRDSNQARIRLAYFELPREVQRQQEGDTREIAGGTGSPASAARSQSQTAAPRVPLWLPHKLQQNILDLVQQLLEEGCYEFAAKWLPDELTRHAWNCVEDVDLTTWARILTDNLGELDRQGAVRLDVTTDSDELFKTAEGIQRWAVERRRMFASRIADFVRKGSVLLRMLQDARRATRFDILAHELEQCDQRGTVTPVLQRLVPGPRPPVGLRALEALGAGQKANERVSIGDDGSIAPVVTERREFERRQFPIQLGGIQGGHGQRFTAELLQDEQETVVMVMDSLEGDEMGAGVSIRQEGGQRISDMQSTTLRPGQDPNRMVGLNDMLRGAVLALEMFGLIPT